MQSSQVTPNMRLTSQGFRAFAPEIRKMIFEECLHYKGETPDLLKALRTDPLLYEEALAIYNKINTVVTLNLANNWDHTVIEKKKLKHGKILKIEVK